MKQKRGVVSLKNQARAAAGRSTMRKPQAFEEYGFVSKHTMGSPTPQSLQKGFLEHQPSKKGVFMEIHWASEQTPKTSQTPPNPPKPPPKPPQTPPNPPKPPQTPKPHQTPPNPPKPPQTPPDPPKPPKLPQTPPNPPKRHKTPPNPPKPTSNPPKTPQISASSRSQCFARTWWRSCGRCLKRPGTPAHHETGRRSEGLSFSGRWVHKWCVKWVHK